MPSEIILAGLISAFVAALGVLVNAIVNRRRDAEVSSNTKESNDIARVEILLNQQSEMIKDLQTEVKTLKEEVSDLQKQRDDDRAEYKRDLAKIRQVVKDYLTTLLIWDSTREGPLPLPSEEDLAILEITLPPRTRRR